MNMSKIMMRLLQHHKSNRLSIFFELFIECEETLELNVIILQTKFIAIIKNE